MEIRNEEKALVIVSETSIQSRIQVIRGINVILDTDLASMYQIETKNLKRQVRRNISRFPTDFMFEMTEDEVQNLRCQNVTTSNTHGGNRYLPFAFTELGVAMLSSVLSSEVAVQVNIAIMRAFAAMRHYIAHQSKLDADVNALKAKLELLSEQRESDLGLVNDLSEEIGIINQAIAELASEIKEKQEMPRNKIGF